MNSLIPEVIIHIWMGHVRFHTLWRDQYTEAHVAWITVSYTRASFIPIIYSTILRGNKHHLGYLSLRLETMHYKTHLSTKWFAIETLSTDGGPIMHEPQVSSTH